MPRRKNGTDPETAPKRDHNSQTMNAAIVEAHARFAKLAEEKREIGEAQADLVNGLKETFGLSKKAIRRAFADMDMDGAETSTFHSDYETVMAALGQLRGTPLGDAALVQPSA